MADRLYRSRSDRMAAGVAGGLAERFDADPSLVRVLWVIVTILSGGLAIIVYVAMAVIVPEADGDPDPIGTGEPATGAPTGTTAAPSATSSTATAGSGWVAPAPRAPRPPKQGDGGRRGAIVVGLVLVLVGAYLLIRQFAPAIDLSLAWPIASIALGVLLVILSVRPTRPA